MFYLDRKKNRKGQLKRWMFTTDPGPKAIGLDVDYTTALEQQGALNAALPDPPAKRKKTDPKIAEGHAYPHSINFPDQLWDAIPESGAGKSAWVRDAVRKRLGLQTNETD